MKDKTAQLAKRAADGDARAFGEIYSLLSADMYRYALYTLNSVEAAQDAVQEAALQAWKNISKLKNVDAAKAWFFKILNRCCKHSLREKYKADFADFDLCAELSAADTADDITLALDLLQLLDKLSAEEKDIVLLNAVCGCNSKEISRITSLPAATVRSKLSRSLKKLRAETEQGGKQ